MKYIDQFIAHYRKSKYNFLYSQQLQFYIFMANYKHSAIIFFVYLFIYLLFFFIIYFLLFFLVFFFPFCVVVLLFGVFTIVWSTNLHILHESAFFFWLTTWVCSPSFVHLPFFFCGCL